MAQGEAPASLPPSRVCHNMKKPTFWTEGETVGWTEREAPHTQRVDGLPKDFERQPLSVRNQAPQAYGNI